MYTYIAQKIAIARAAQHQLSERLRSVKRHMWLKHSLERRLFADGRNYKELFAHQI